MSSGQTCWVSICSRSSRYSVGTLFSYAYVSIALRCLDTQRQSVLRPMSTTYYRTVANDQSARSIRTMQCLCYRFVSLPLGRRMIYATNSFGNANCGYVSTSYGTCYAETPSDEGSQGHGRSAIFLSGFRNRMAS